MKKQRTIPLFIPHLGCPHTCVFCDQKTISGHSGYDKNQIEEEIQTALATIPPETEWVELAFFGGSFTGIPEEDMISLLELGKSYLDSNRINAMRCSTRPDYISPKILSILKSYGMGTIELGIQSMSPSVLALSERGHSPQDSERAMQLVVSNGFQLVGQMMIGLPGSTLADEIQCASRICQSGAVAARIYPTVVFSGTELEKRTQTGSYIPLSIQEACERTSEVIRIFSQHKVKLLRIGLCESDSIRSKQKVVGGAYHPALGELCINTYYRKLIEEKLTLLQTNRGDKIQIHIPCGHLSKVMGQKKQNLHYFQILFPDRLFYFQEFPFIQEYNVEIIVQKSGSNNRI
jgi:histone acetyltransferase (RNA polymerase elongator complex component)